MPKISDEYRTQRRAAIAHATIACLRRQGFSHTTMADIIAESGASAGAIYSHFQSKAEVIRYVAREVVGERMLAVSQLAIGGTGPSPSEVVATMLTSIESLEFPRSVLVQLWAEAATDPEMLLTVRETMEGIRSHFSDTLRDWASRQTPEGASAADLATRTAAAMSAICQGFIVQVALGGSMTSTEFSSIIRALDVPSSDA